MYDLRGRQLSAATKPTGSQAVVACRHLIQAYERFFANPKPGGNWAHCEQRLTELLDILGSRQFTESIDPLFDGLVTSGATTFEDMARLTETPNKIDRAVEISLAKQAGLSKLRTEMAIRRADSRLGRAERRSRPIECSGSCAELVGEFQALHAKIDEVYVRSQPMGWRKKKRARGRVRRHARSRLFSLTTLTANECRRQMFPYSHAISVAERTKRPRGVPNDLDSDGWY